MIRSIFSRGVAAALLLGCVACVAPDEAGDGLASSLPPNTVEPIQCVDRQPDGDLHLYHREFRFDPDLLARFEAEFGLEVLEDFFVSNEAMYTKLQSGASYDLVIASDYMVEHLIAEEYLRELDVSLIPNLANLSARFEDPVFDPGTEHSAAFQWGTTGIGVNLDRLGTDLIPSWSLFFDPAVEVEGGMALLDESREAMAAALRYLGYSPSTRNEGELEAASALLSDARDRQVQFRGKGRAEALVDGDLVVAQVRSGEMVEALEGVDDPSSFSYVIPEDGGTFWVDSMVVPLAAENPCTAHAFINFILELETAGEIANWGRYASPNGAAQGLIEPSLLDNQLVYPTPEQLELAEVLRSAGPVETKYTEYFLLGRG